MIPLRQALVTTPGRVELDRNDRGTLDVVERWFRYERDEALAAGLLDEARELLTDPDPTLRSAALFLFLQADLDDAGALLDAWTHHPELFDGVVEHWGRQGDGDLRQRLATCLGHRLGRDPAIAAALRAEALAERPVPAGLLLAHDPDWTLAHLGPILRGTPHALGALVRTASPEHVGAVLDAARAKRTPWQVVQALRSQPALLAEHAAVVCAPVLDAAAVWSRVHWGVRASTLELRADEQGFVAWAFGADSRAEAGGVAVAVGDEAGFEIIARAERCWGCGGRPGGCETCGGEMVCGWSGEPRRGTALVSRQLAGT